MTRFFSTSLLIIFQAEKTKQIVEKIFSQAKKKQHKLLTSLCKGEKQHKLLKHLRTSEKTTQIVKKFTYKQNNNNTNC